MRKQIGTLAAVCLVIGGMSVAGSNAARAQDQASNANGAATPPPAVLVINREFLKPGSEAGLHGKAESAIAQSLAQSNSPDHYLGMVSLSGQLRAAFWHGYDSFADWQKAVGADMHNPSLMQSLGPETQTDEGLLMRKDTGVFVYRPDMSVNPAVDIAHMRFAEITAVKVKALHDADYEKALKVFNSIFGKVPNAHWAAYQMKYGDASGVYIFITPMRSLGYVDADQKGTAEAAQAAGADQMQQLNQLGSASIESITSNIYAFDPDMSYVGAKWKAADPGFWKQ